MSVTETFASSTTFLKICMVLAPLQTVVYITGLSFNNWVTVTRQFLGNEIKGSAGLWEKSVCYLQLCKTEELDSVPDWLHVTRSFAVIGLIGFLLVTAGVFVCLFVTSLSQRRLVHILTTVTAIGTGVAVLVAIAMYGYHQSNTRRPAPIMNLGLLKGHPDSSKTESVAVILARKFFASNLSKPTVNPGWAVGMCMAALILDVITTILLVINAVKKPKK